MKHTDSAETKQRYSSYSPLSKELYVGYIWLCLFKLHFMVCQRVKYPCKIIFVARMLYSVYSIGISWNQNYAN